MDEVGTEVWTRRIALMAVIGLIVAIPVTIVIRGRGGDSEPTITPVSPTRGGEFDRDVGVELRLPKGWSRERKEGFVVFRSKDRHVLISVSVPGPVSDVGVIQQQAIDAIGETHEAVEILDRDKGRRLGGRPAQIAVIAARNPENQNDLRILIATAKGENLAYLVQVFAAAPNAGQALAEAQALLNGMRLVG
ncbi:MAG: hypothetical protein M3383_00775 [Actinomycetota bacterium]|nr:hypothetical protein [Actinomycetota bacterium]